MKSLGAAEKMKSLTDKRIKLEPTTDLDRNLDGKRSQLFKHYYPCPYATPGPKKGLNRSSSNQNSLIPKMEQRNMSVIEPIGGGGGSPLLDQKKSRPLPIHNKEEVFNEWGAILKHQDEIDQKIQQENFEKMKLRQLSYKMELDRQYKELQARKKGSQNILAQKENELIKFQQKQVEQRAHKEDAHKIKLKNDQKVDAQMGFSELQEKQKQEQQMRDMEKDMQRDKLMQEQRINEERLRNEKMKKRDEENKYSQMLALQARERENKKKQEKEADKQFLISETNKLKTEENQRSLFFNKLKKIQEDNDQKHKSLLKYMSQDQAVINSKKDEKNYIKAIEVGEKKAVKKEFENKRNRDYTTQNNMDVLTKQLQEKKLTVQNEREQQAFLAKQFQDEVDKARKEDQDQKDKIKQRQAEYQQQLNLQLKEKNKRKQYSVLMSEYERSVNDNDIKAYQNMDTSSLSAKIPGFTKNSPQEKYLDKAMNLGAAETSILYSKPQNSTLVEMPK